VTDDLPELTVREATLTDVQAVAAIHVEGYESAHRGLFPDENLAVRTLELRTRVWGERLADPPESSFVVVAEQEGEVVGFLSGRASRPDEDDGEGLGRWEDIYVASKCRPRGRVVAAMKPAAYDLWKGFGFPGVVGFIAEPNTRALRFFTEEIGMHQDGHSVEIDGVRVLRVRADF